MTKVSPISVQEVTHLQPLAEVQEVLDIKPVSNIQEVVAMKEKEEPEFNKQICIIYLFIFQYVYFKTYFVNSQPLKSKSKETVGALKRKRKKKLRISKC